MIERPSHMLPVKLPVKEQKELMELIFKLLLNSRNFSVTSRITHEKEYLEIQDKLNSLGIRSINESYEFGYGNYDIDIRFQDVLGNLIDFDKIKFEE